MLFGGELRREETLARCLALVVVATAASGGGCLLPALDLRGKSCVAQDDCGDLVCVDNRCAAAGDRELRDAGSDGGGPLDSGAHDAG